MLCSLFCGTKGKRKGEWLWKRISVARRVRCINKSHFTIFQLFIFSFSIRCSTVCLLPFAVCHLPLLCLLNQKSRLPRFTWIRFACVYFLEHFQNLPLAIYHVELAAGSVASGKQQLLATACKASHQHNKFPLDYSCVCVYYSFHFGRFLMLVCNK